MRTAGGLSLLLLCLTSRAQGQVSVDMRALDSLGPAQPAARPAPAPARSPAAVPAVHATTSRPAGAGASASPAGAPAAAAMVAPAAGTPAAATAATGTATAGDHAARQASTAGTAAPRMPAASNAPVPALPTARPAAPPPSTMVPAQAASPSPLPPPVRLVFEEGKTELTPADEAAIQGLARSIPAPAADSVNVVAYAAGKPDDPSTARRLSLSRGLAVRSVLMASGIPSAQIYVRALGATPSDGPADRVELTVAPIGTVTR